MLLIFHAAQVSVGHIATIQYCLPLASLIPVLTLPVESVQQEPALCRFLKFHLCRTLVEGTPALSGFKVTIAPFVPLTHSIAIWISVSVTAALGKL